MDGQMYVLFHVYAGDSKIVFYLSAALLKSNLDPLF
jgi:hypothetical protein